MSRMSRRNFLKILGLSSPLLLFPNLFSRVEQSLKVNSAALPNIIFLVFDAMSAKNLSLYGYPRLTSPNLERFANRSTVYHSHYSSGNFTIPGTASMLTGTYPWTHRALNFRGTMARSMIGNDIFAVLGSDYTRLAFPQNFWANFILSQLEEEIDILLSSGAFAELNFLFSDLFPNDANMAARALDDFVFKGGGQSPTLLFNPIERGLYSAKRDRLPNDGYPESIPFQADYPVHFRLEKIFSGLASLLSDLKSPFFTYLHLLPPHEPYIASNYFANLFKDGLNSTFPNKPVHPLSGGKSPGEILGQRRKYDEYIASTDHEFGKFFDSLKKSGLLENSYVFITSDHGEMFERGALAHATPLLYDPVIHVPLIVSAPGQQKRRDIYTPTNAVDILSTIAKLIGSSTSFKTEGDCLPGLGGEDNYERSIYVVEGKLNAAHLPLKIASFVLRKGNQKLIYYKGYDTYNAEDVFEFYDLNDDPEEMKNLYKKNPAGAAQMKEELLEMIYAADKPYT